MTNSHTTATEHLRSRRKMEAEITRLREALTDIRTVCAETHAGLVRAHAALSKIDGAARRGLG